jgi:hypothetical protein
MPQSAQGSWSNLKQLQPGQRIELAGTNMKSLRGPFVAVSEEVFTLQVCNSQESIERARVVRACVRDTTHRTPKMMLELGILGRIALGAVFVPFAISTNEGNSCGAYVAGSEAELPK